MECLKFFSEIDWEFLRCRGRCLEQVLLKLFVFVALAIVEETSE